MNTKDLDELRELKAQKDIGNLDGFGWARLTSILYKNIDYIISVGESSKTKTHTFLEVIQILKNVGIDPNCGACMEVAYTGVTTNTHTHSSGT